eukprot:scaffold141345_cov31-Prasinocladus_malaysianus.AAC.1
MFLAAVLLFQVSSIVLEELHQQHMDEVAEWEAERKRLQADVAELKAWRVQAETKGLDAQRDFELEADHPSAQLVQVEPSYH